MKKIIMFAIVFALTFASLCVNASAAPATGSINLVLINKADKKPMEGREIVITRIADCEMKDSGPVFTYTSDFAGFDLDLAEPENVNLLYTHIISNKISGKTATSDKNGKVSFKNLETGAYLVYSSDGLFNPFVASVPMVTEEGLVYDVNAEPKIDYTEGQPIVPIIPIVPIVPIVPILPIIPIIPIIPDGPDSSTTSPDDTTSRTYPGGGVIPTGPVTPVVPGGTPGDITSVTVPGKDTPESGTPKLPQTGMVQYPIPVLGFMGILMFAAGFIIYGSGKKKENQN